ncbi:hypothetical protein CP10139811_1009 [Chlamydia ibidis]|uniref:Uncharacterized protein n=2 Tax=Chlamydia ibidis TaxID=1405396 RepID=S7J5B5_9CHLA|nr:hypothetical protein CP10139811_1009 [Chlamydia ibidis]EQM63031.1 hypothetical protein H359_0327 [Chlamydia ibidis 10-1398/6]
MVIDLETDLCYYPFTLKNLNPPRISLTWTTKTQYESLPVIL